MGFGIGYGAEEYAKISGATLVIKSEVANKSVDFPAFLTDFTQTFASEWATEQVYGRNDPIATFQGTKRTISLAWDIPSATLADAKKNLEKCGDLASFLYPGYMSTAPLPKKKGKGGSKGAKKADKKDMPKKKTKHNPRHASILSKSPLVRVTFANLIATESVAKKGSTKKTNAQKKQAAAQQENKNTTTQKEKGEKSTKNKKNALSTKGLLGWIDSLTWKPVLDMGMFSDGNKFYPKVISLNFNLNVLHEHFLGWGNSGWMGAKFPFKL